MVTSIVLENLPGKEERHAALLNALREHFAAPELTVEYTPKGKPFLPGEQGFISVTTTGQVMICVISDTPVGLDGELMTRFTGESRTDYTALAERFFTDEEAEYVREGEDTAVRFAKVWIRKEAYCKYTGKGLSDFSNFAVTDGERFYTKVNGTPIRRLNVTFPGSGEYLFAVAGECAAEAVRPESAK